MSTSLNYPTPAASLPDAQFTWLDHQNNVIDFSTGWTFKMTIGRPPNSAAITKTTNISGTSGLDGDGNPIPNLNVVWGNSELSVLTSGVWYFQITATNSSGQQRILSGSLRIDASIIQ